MLNPAQAISSLLPDLSASGNLVRSLWDRLGHTKAGRHVFSKAIGRFAPYTGSIGAHVEELKTGYARVSLRDRPKVRNHLDCLHAIALANLAELTGNIAVAYSMPSDARFIVAGIEMNYLKKARGTIIGECNSPVPDSAARQEYLVRVTMRDQRGDAVAEATMRTLIGPKTR